MVNSDYFLRSDAFAIDLEDHMRTQQKAEQQQLVDEWKAVPEGTPVIVTKDNGTEFHTKTRSMAWLLGEHTAVIMVEGISGGYALERVRKTKGQ